MVMQFPELENPGQISPCHSCTSLGFAMEMMSMKPAKGRRRFSDAGGGASATGLRKHGALLLEIPVTDRSSPSFPITHITFKIRLVTSVLEQ